MLSWIFGPVKLNVVHLSQKNKTAGFLELENARVRWFLSLDNEDIPLKIKEKGQRTFRSIKIDNKEIEFSGGFTELHTESYKKILSGKGYGIKDACLSIQTVYSIRNTKGIGRRGDYHPFIKNINF